MGFNLMLGDCLVKMKEIESGSCDCIICDLPYGVLNKSNPNAKWDCMIPLEPLWKEWLRVCKENAAIVLFAQGLFTGKLMMSNPDIFRYSLVWNKTGHVSGFLNAKRMPLRSHEDILVFYRALPTYNPQMEKCEPHKRNHSRGKGQHKQTNRCYGQFKEAEDFISDEKYPRSVLSFPRPHPNVHPTQKSTELCQWLVRTYTNPGDTVLDSTMGSGTTGIAAVMEGRNFIGIESEQKYYDLSKKRIEEAASRPKQTELF